MNFKTRGFVSITLTLSFVILTLSGIVKYIMPPGRIAYWTNWVFFGLTKDNWDGVHTIVGFVFILAAFVHFYYNWTVFLHYIKSKLHKGLRLNKEVTVSVLLMGIIMVGTIGDIPPFRTVMKVGGSIKESWGSEANRAPIPHTELMTLQTITENLDLSSENVVDTLESNGIKIENTEETIKSIARENDMSPQELYQIIAPRRGGDKELGRGNGRRN